MNRQENNILIAEKILEICKNPKYKDLRFGQILTILHIIEYDSETNGIAMPKDIFNEESLQTFERMKEKQS